MILWLLGCPVPIEWAGVDPPRPGGVEALAMEDFERDLWLLGQPNRQANLERRWQEMGLTLEGGCGVRAGESPARVLIQANDDPSAAMAISLAKTVDNTTPPKTLVFCAGPYEGAADATLKLVGPSRKADQLVRETEKAYAELGGLLGL